MTTEELKALLGEDKFRELESLFAAKIKAAYARGKDANGWAAFFRGVAKSATQRVALLAVSWPMIEPMITRLVADHADALSGYLPPASASMWISIMGVIMFVLRIKTTTSLEDRGAAPQPMKENP